MSYHARPGIDGESAGVRHDTKRQASAYKKEDKRARDGEDSPPEALPSELDIVLQLAELVRLDRLVPRHDHLADELSR